MTPPPAIIFWVVGYMVSSNDFDRFPSRKSPRLKFFDYTAPNYYFVTICTWEKRCLFSQSGTELNQFGEIAKRTFENIPQHFPTVKVDKFVVMPNHVHGILILNEQNVDLSTVVGQYKSHVTHQIHLIYPGCREWQTSFHDHIIRNQADYERIWNYIEANPARWQGDCFYSYTENELPRWGHDPALR